ncbi:sulfate ABC transporter substrate-binding protein [Noviherbaspirillum galbum]|uniref:Sulfate ABC transporter substrate-binding protein n=1 Tax=Noviherbaspirillum galbum TaxID=2709383 RepID=A0A6B3STQ8_9BURK|nr:sulfate ABC transporter substrate-binding protein [Noviherbaspirillum galbum]NEX63991.1 sulfate ABC transporter substrate-binding protein [Noviherbaspirillum galbum]
MNPISPTRLAAILAIGTALASSATRAADVQLLNVSYDPTRELYSEYNKVFAKYWQDKTGDKVTVKQSHGGSGKQARSVIDGLEADVVTLGLAYDIDAIAEQAKLLPQNWQARLPNNSTPYTSTVVFLVRKGNPKQVKNWSDLVKPGVSVIASNPKTSAGGRWAYLGAYGYAFKTFQGDENRAKDFIARFYKNVPVLDSGARGSTTTFVERGIGDALISWEDEALLAVKQDPSKFDIVVPPLSIQAEPPVSVVDKVVDKKGTRKVAEAYLQYLYTPEAQEIAARHFYRPTDKTVYARHARQFAKLDLFTVKEVFGDWHQIQKKHLADGALFDQIYLK